MSQSTPRPGLQRAAGRSPNLRSALGYGSRWSQLIEAHATGQRKRLARLIERGSLTTAYATASKGAGSQPPDRGRIDVEAASDVGLSLTAGQPCKRFLPLVRRQLARATKPHATILRGLPALPCPSTDQLTLELRQATQDRKHQAAARAGRVGPCILQ